MKPTSDMPVRLAIAATVAGHLAGSKQFSTGGDPGVDIDRCAAVSLMLADKLIEITTQKEIT